MRIPILLVGLVIIGCGARAPIVLEPSLCACATEMAQIRGEHMTLLSAHAKLATEHYSICRVGHWQSTTPHDIRPR